MAADEPRRLARPGPSGTGRAPARAILTSTNPVVASALADGRPRGGEPAAPAEAFAAAEAAANDGFAFIFVLVPALVLTLPGDDVGAIAGEAIGQVAVRAGHRPRSASSPRRSSSRRGSPGDVRRLLPRQPLALALLTLGAVDELGGTGILGAFVAGLTFSLCWRSATRSSSSGHRTPSDASC